MKVIQIEEVIPPQPEKKVTRSYYVASDGKEFLFKSGCELYEKQLEVKNHPVFKSCIGVHTFWDDDLAKLYYFRDQEDYEFWSDNIGVLYFDVNHWENDFGPGWYLFYTIDGGDWEDSHYLYKLDEYERGIKNDLEHWHTEIVNKIAKQEE